MEKINNTSDVCLENIKKLMIEGLREITKSISELSGDKVKIAVLFSGGLDSTLIARLLDFVLPKN